MHDPSQLFADAEVLNDFVDEARAHLNTISAGLLHLEAGTGDGEVVDSVARSLHTIKGVSSFIDLRDINQLSRAGENVLDAIRDDAVKPNADVVDTLLSTYDLLTQLVEVAGNDEATCAKRARVAATISQLHAILDAHPREPLANRSASGDQLRESAPPIKKAATAQRSFPTDLWPPPGTGLAPRLVAQFVTESEEHLDELEQCLLAIEKDPTDVEQINTAFRAIHSVKGTADYVGLVQLKTLSHHLESVFQLIRSDQLAINPEIDDLILQATDALRSMITQLRPDTETDHDLKDLVVRLLAVTNAAQDAEQPVARTPIVSHRPATRLGIFLASAEQHVESIERQAAKLLDDDVTDTTTSTLLRSLTTLRNAADYVERDEFIAPCEQLIDLLENLPAPASSVDDTTRATIQELAGRLRARMDQVRIEVDSPERADGVPGDQDSAGAPPARDDRPDSTPDSSGTDKPAVAKTLRVDQEKLDAYINLAGELVIARNSLAHAFREFQTNRNGGLRAMKSAIDGLDRITSMIQDNAMVMRMVPVKTMFQRFPRVVRDIAKSQGKRISLHISGEETELDKQVAETLGDPLVHLIRNAADHGIELPAVRRAAGKSETGNITLKAGREGNHVVIDVIDDGAGINVDRLKKKAVENGVVTAARAAALTRDETLNLIFSPGLSTANKITDISGRGVGMDVVRTNITDLGGTVSVSSEKSAGTHLRIHLRLTLAVTTALLVQVDRRTYAIPIDIVAETVKVRPANIQTLNGHWAITLRGTIIPMKSLGDMLGHQTPDPHVGVGQPARAYDRAPRRSHASFGNTDARRARGTDQESSSHAGNVCPRPRADQTGHVSIVVADIGGKPFGLVVDAMLGQQEIVLKPLPSYLANLPGLGSATVLGDGTIVLVLDPTTLYAAALDAGAARRRANEKQEGRGLGGGFRAPCRSF